MDAIRLFTKNEKELETKRKYREDTAMEFGIKMDHAYNEKWKKTNNGRNRTAKIKKE